MNKSILLIIFLTAGFHILMNAQDNLPEASAAYLFDEPSWTGPTIEDATGNGHNAYWYSYWVETGEEERPKWAGYREGKFGNAMKMNGFHDWGCASEEPCPKEDQFFHTSSLDFIVFSGNNDEKQIVPHDSLFTEVWDSSFTIAYWFKSIRDYSKNEKPYPSEDTTNIGMVEVEYHVCFGDVNQGIVVRNFKGFLNVNIKGEDDEGNIHEVKFIEIVDPTTFTPAEQEWQHVAIIFDKKAGKFSAYLDGTLASEYVGFPAEAESDITKIDMGYNSAEFGTLNNATIVETLPAFWGSDPTGTEGLQMIDANKLRAGWPFAGFVDELVIYKNLALDQAQLQMLIDSGYMAATDAGNNTNISASRERKLTIYPNPSSGNINISEIPELSGHVKIEVVNLVGQIVYKKDINYSGGTVNLTLPNDLSGIFTVMIKSEKAPVYSERLILAK